jgi:integrase
MFLAHLTKNHQENEHPDIFTRNDIDRFMRIIEKDTMTYNPRFNVDGTIKDKVIPLSPVSYNLYLSRLAFFYEFLVIERVCVYNACKGAHRYKISNLKTRYTIFEDDELETVRELLKSSPDYLDMLLSSHLLYSYRIRFKEQLKIRVGWIDFKTGILSLPERTIEHGKVVKTTKNGNSATFQLSERLLKMIKSYLGSNIKERDFFLFGGKNESGSRQKSNSYFSKKWEIFKRDNNLPDHLKFYALKHTSNYNSFEQLGIEGLSQINRHKKISQTQAYINSKLSKKTIIINSENEF